MINILSLLYILLWLYHYNDTIILLKLMKKCLTKRKSKDPNIFLSLLIITTNIIFVPFVSFIGKIGGQPLDTELPSSDSDICDNNKIE